jgi:hypothetical protein
VTPSVHPLQLALQALATLSLLGAFVYAAVQFREYFFNLMQLSVFEIVWFAARENQVPRD